MSEQPDRRLGWHERELSERTGEDGISGRETMRSWRLRNGLDSPETMIAWLVERELERLEREASDLEAERILYDRERTEPKSAFQLERERQAERMRAGKRIEHERRTDQYRVVGCLACMLSPLVLLAMGWALYHALRWLVALALYLPLA